MGTTSLCCAHLDPLRWSLGRESEILVESTNICWRAVGSYIVSYRSFLDRRESGPRKVAWTHSHSASLGSLPLRAHHLPAGPIARSGKPAGSLVGGVMTSRKVLLCGEILEKMHFHLILEINLTFKIKIKHIK